jgi:pimeloyl-ACP methyl ester carboxylesterase
MTGTGRRPFRAVALAVAAGVLASLAPAHAAPAQGAPARSAPSASSGAPPAARLSWAGCGADFPVGMECATLRVPLDHARPSGPTTGVAVSRIRTAVPQKRRGVLLLNPGGPSPGLGLPAELVRTLPRSVRDQYDLIGFDPRGLGRSAVGGCGLDPEDVFHPPAPYRPETFAADVARARRIAERCRDSPDAERLRTVTTRNIARDMDAVRAALGERRISYLGMSFGSYLGAVYTELFPHRADRIVLDSGADPRLMWRDLIRDSAREAERAFTRWTRWTARYEKVYGLGATPREVRRTFRDLVARANRTPVELGGVRYGGDEIRHEVMYLVADPPAVAALVGALVRAADGTGVPAAPGGAGAPAPAADTVPGAGPGSPGLPGVPGFPGSPGLPALAGVPAAAPAVPRAAHPAHQARPAERAQQDRRTPGAETPWWDSGMAAVWSLVCGDDSAEWPRDPEQYRRESVRDKARYPLAGDFVSVIRPCAFWQRGPEPVTAVDNRVGALVLQHEWDLATSATSGFGLHRAMKGSRMVFVAGGRGHGVYFTDRDPCAVAHTDIYLTTGRLPARNTVCRAPAPVPPATPPAPDPPGRPGDGRERAGRNPPPLQASSMVRKP